MPGLGLAGKRKSGGASRISLQDRPPPDRRIQKEEDRMRKKTNNSRAKKPYQKPLIGLVKLTPEEAVLAGCKMTTSSVGAGPAKAGCTTGGGTTPCKILAS